MKQLILFLFMGISIWSYAQPDKGNFLVSGSLSFSHLNRKYNVALFQGSQVVFTDHVSKSSNFSLSPEVAFFPFNRMGVGLAVPFSYSWASSHYPELPRPEESSHSNYIGIGPFLRYYLPLRAKFFLLAEGRYSWGFTRGQQNYYNDIGGVWTPNESEWKDRTRQYQFGVGLAYFIYTNVAIELLGTYSHNAQMNLSNIMAQAGFQLYFEKH